MKRRLSFSWTMGMPAALLHNFLHQGSVSYPLMIAVHICGSCDIDSTTITACIDIMSVSANECAVRRGQACIAWRMVFTVTESSSSSSGQNSYRDLVDSTAASLEVQRLIGSQESASAMVFSPSLMYTILASNCDMNSIQCAWHHDRSGWILKFSSILWFAKMVKVKPTRSARHFCNVQMIASISFSWTG